MRTGWQAAIVAANQKRKARGRGSVSGGEVLSSGQRLFRGCPATTPCMPEIQGVACETILCRALVLRPLFGDRPDVAAPTGGRPPHVKRVR